MATSHGIVTQAASTAIAPVTQNFTKTGLGTVKGYQIFGSHVTTLNTDVAHMSFHCGGSDLAAVNGFSLGANDEDNQVTSDSKVLIFNNELLRLCDPGTDVANESCNHNATVTDGIQVNWTATATARQVSALMLKEGIANYDVQMITLGGTGSTTVTPGFQADIVIVEATGNATIAAPNGSRGGMQFYHRADDVYAGMYFLGTHGDTTPDSAEHYTTTALGGEVIITTGAQLQHYTLGNFTSTAFDATKVSGTRATVVKITSIKLDAGYSAKVGTIDGRTITGNHQTISGLTFTPQVGMFCGTQQTAAGGSAAQCSFHMGACDADNEFSVGGFIQDAGGSVQNTNTGTHHRSDACIYSTNDVGTVRSKAALVSLDSDGVTFNWITALDAVKIAYLVIGLNAATNTGSHIKQRLFAT